MKRREQNTNVPHFISFRCSCQPPLLSVWLVFNIAVRNAKYIKRLLSDVHLKSISTTYQSKLIWIHSSTSYENSGLYDLLPLSTRRRGESAQHAVARWFSICSSGFSAFHLSIISSWLKACAIDHQLWYKKLTNWVVNRTTDRTSCKGMSNAELANLLPRPSTDMWLVHGHGCGYRLSNAIRIYSVLIFFKARTLK